MLQTSNTKILQNFLFPWVKLWNWFHNENFFFQNYKLIFKHSHHHLELRFFLNKRPIQFFIPLSKKIFGLLLIQLRSVNFQFQYRMKNVDLSTPHSISGTVRNLVVLIGAVWKHGVFAMQNKNKKKKRIAINIQREARNSHLFHTLGAILIWYY